MSKSNAALAGNAEYPIEKANSALAAGFKLSHRRRAMLGDVFDRLAAREDFRMKLEKQAMEDPKGFLDWLGRQLPNDPAAPAAAAPALGSLNIGQLFLAAARGDPAPALPALPVIDAEHVEVEHDDW